MKIKKLFSLIERASNKLPRRRKPIWFVIRVLVGIPQLYGMLGPQGVYAPAALNVPLPQPTVNGYQWDDNACSVKAEVRSKAYVREQLWVACKTINQVWERYGAEAMVTGMAHRDIHRHDTYHVEGWAWDFRIWNIRTELRIQAFTEACEKLRELDDLFRVVLFDTGNRDSRPLHMHVEFRHDYNYDKPGCDVN